MITHLYIDQRGFSSFVNSLFKGFYFIRKYVNFLFVFQIFLYTTTLKKNTVDLTASSLFEVG